MKRNILVAFLAVLLVCSCSHKKLASNSHEMLMPQKEQVWQLVSMQGRTTNLVAATPTLCFNPEAHTASGFAYCNSYSFRYESIPVDIQPDGDYHTLSLEPWGTGELGCPEADLNAEQRYLSLLAKATSFRLTSTTLTLFQRNKEILYFELQ